MTSAPKLFGTCFTNISIEEEGSRADTTFIAPDNHEMRFWHKAGPIDAKIYFLLF